MTALRDRWIVPGLARMAGWGRDTRTGNWVAGATTGTGVVTVGANALLQYLGITAVAHSSGTAILTAGSGYIAGTLGTGAWIVWALTSVLVLPIALVCILGGVWILVTKRKRHRP